MAKDPIFIRETLAITVGVLVVSVSLLSGGTVAAHEKDSFGQELADGIIEGMGGDSGAFDRGYKAGSANASQNWIDGYEAGAGQTPGPVKVPAGQAYDGGLKDLIEADNLPGADFAKPSSRGVCDTLGSQTIPTNTHCSDHIW